MKVKERHFLKCSDIFFLLQLLIGKAELRAQMWESMKNKAK